MKRLPRVTNMQHAKVQIYNSMFIPCNVFLFHWCTHWCTGSYIYSYTFMRDSHLLSQFAAVIIGPYSNQNTDINRLCAMVWDIRPAASAAKHSQANKLFFGVWFVRDRIPNKSKTTNFAAILRLAHDLSVLEKLNLPPCSWKFYIDLLTARLSCF